MKRIVEVYIGEYASGKSENAVNRSLDLAQRVYNAWILYIYIGKLLKEICQISKWIQSNLQY